MKASDRRRASGALLCLLVLGACDASPGQVPAPDNRAVRAVPPPTLSPNGQPSGKTSSPATDARTDVPGPTILSCAAELGADAAERRAEVCRNVSPATRPPCNAANSCAMIEDETARGCAFLEGKGQPIASCEPRPASMEAAAAVVRRYYSALNARDFDTAWRQWGVDGPPNQTAAQFRAGFARTRSTAVTIGRLEPGGGAAGSVFQEVPVTVVSTLDDGTRQRFRGRYVARRVNGVEGASPEQLRWRIDSARLSAAPVPR